MDIVIKSSNRIYMLDHALRSVYKFAGQTVDRVIISDDGTPDRYLNEIALRYPNLILVKSGRVIDESVHGGAGQSVNLARAIKCWREAVEQVRTDYFLLLEEDFWLTAPADLAVIADIMKREKTVFLSAMPGNIHFEELPDVDYTQCDTTFRIGRPTFLNQSLANIGFQYIQLSQFSQYKMRFLAWRLARRLWLHPKNQWIKNYQVYGVAGAIFERRWWLDLWDDDQAEIDEGLQIDRALKSLLANPELTVGYIDSQMLKTTVRSSSTESTLEGRPRFAVSMMNKTLNEAWLYDCWMVGDHDSDLAVTEISQVFASSGLEESFSEEWISWWRSIELDRKRLGFIT